MPKFKEFMKGFEEPEAQPEVKPQEVKPQPKKYEGGIAKDMQTAGFEPYEVDEKKNLLRVKDKAGADYEISQGEGWSFNVAKDGKPIYRNVPNYMRFDTVVAGKPERGFEKYQIKEEQPKPAPKPGSFSKMIEGFDEPEQKQFSKEETALADKAAEVLSHYAWGQGFKVEKLPNGNYLTNLHLDDPDAEPQEVGPDFMLQEREKLLKSGDERFAELWEEYNK